MRPSYPHKPTWLHAVNPTLKLAIFSLWFVAVILIHDFNVMANVAALSVLLLAWSGHPWRRLLLYASPFLLVFVSTSTGMMMFGTGETEWWSWGPVHVTRESFFRGLHLGFRALSMASAGLLFGLTTRPVALFYSLMQQAKLPPKYAYGFMAAIRMMPILIEEFQTRRNALRIRGSIRRGWWRRFYDGLSRYAVPLLAQSIRRAHRVAVAMEAKRFAGNAGRTYYYVIGYSYRDVLFVLLTAALFAIGALAGKLFPYANVTDVR